VYYSVDAYKEAYDSFLRESCLQKSEIRTSYSLERAEQSPYMKFIREAERINPELQQAYHQARKEVLSERKAELVRLLSHETMYFHNAHIYWSNEVSTHCPGELDQALVAYRSSHWDKIVQDADRTYTNPEFKEWIDKELQEHTKTHHRPAEIKADELISFIEQNRDAVVQAIEEGRLSIQDIASILGQEYNIPDRFVIEQHESNVEVTDPALGNR
jgi:hypothetical protein